MNFKEFKKLVEINTQDAQSKMPTLFTDWQSIILQSIKNLAKEIVIDELLVIGETEDEKLRFLIDKEDEKLSIKMPIKITDENSEININEELIMAIVYDVCQLLSKDINMKQKFILDRQDVISTYNWNQYIKGEMSKCLKQLQQSK